MANHPQKGAKKHGTHEWKTRENPDGVNGATYSLSSFELIILCRLRTIAEEKIKTKEGGWREGGIPTVVARKIGCILFGS